MLLLLKNNNLPEIGCCVDLVPIAVSELVAAKWIHPQLCSRQLVHLELEREEKYSKDLIC